jgi:integrase
MLRTKRAIGASLPDIRFHDFRHTWATLLLAAGVHPKVAQERNGHSQIGITLDTYSHVVPTMQIEAATKLDAMMRFSRKRAESRRRA